MYQMPRESTESIPFEVNGPDGEPITEGVTVSLHPEGTRATTYLPAVIIDGKTHVLAANLRPGYYLIQALVAVGTEVHAVDCGKILVT